VVIFLGPFTVEAGQSNTHKYIMPNYVGSVRTMIVAENNGGSATIGTFTILADTTELLEKNPSDVVFVNAGTDVLGAKVGFTN